MFLIQPKPGMVFSRTFPCWSLNQGVPTLVWLTRVLKWHHAAYYGSVYPMDDAFSHSHPTAGKKDVFFFRKLVSFQLQRGSVV